RTGAIGFERSMAQRSRRCNQPFTKPRRSIANQEHKIFTMPLLRLGSINPPTHFLTRCKKLSAPLEENGLRPHLSPLPRGEEDTVRVCWGYQGGRSYAKRPVRVISRARSISICCI